MLHGGLEETQTQVRMSLLSSRSHVLTLCRLARCTEVHLINKQIEELSLSRPEEAAIYHDWTNHCQLEWVERAVAAACYNAYRIGDLTLEQPIHHSHCLSIDWEYDSTKSDLADRFSVVRAELRTHVDVAAEYIRRGGMGDAPRTSADYDASDPNSLVSQVATRSRSAA